MKYDSLFLVLGLLCPVMTLAQDTVTVRIDTGTCAPSYATDSPNGSVSGVAGYGGVASGSQGLTTLSSASNSIVPASTSLSLTSAGSISSTTIQSSTAINIIPSVMSPSSPATTGPATSPSASIDLSGFLLRYSEPAPIFMHPFQRRQTSTIFSGYATASGQTSANCHDSMVYSLSDSGTLSAGGGTVFSTSQGTVYQRFNASANIQNIYATWQVSNQTVLWTNNLYNTLVWNNNLFSNNTASFCVIHGVVRIYFLFPPVQDCMPVNLAILPLSSCKYRIPPPRASVSAAPSMSGSSNGSIYHPYYLS